MIGRRIIASVALGLLTSACTIAETSTAPSAGSRVAVVVTRVVDGDTAHVDLDGRDVTVRFIGIDTPEVAPDQPRECFGPEASAYTTDRLEAQEVDLEFDVERTDRYDRTLAYIWIGQELFNETLVREGYALITTFPPNVRYVERYIEAQRAARSEGAGLWGACGG
ncbi:MAG: thermonuclease family protein [Actinomycetota bacterium]